MQSPDMRAPELKRALGWASAGAIMAGSVIGTAIFLVPSTIARELDSVGWSFFVWMFGGLLSLAGALSYAELGAAFPEAGGEYAFLRRAYGPLWGFLFGWQQVVIGKTGSIATIATGFAIFLGFFVDGLQQEWLHLSWGESGWGVTGLQFVAMTAVASFSLINCFGVGRGGAVQSFLTVLKVAAIVTLAGLVLGAGKGSWDHFQDAPEHTAGTGWGAFAAALAAVLWAYDGWNNLTLVGSEIRDPEHTIPKVFLLGLLAVMGVYLLANFAYFYALPLDAVKHSEQVAQDVAQLVFGDFGGAAITAAAVVSTLAALNGSILSGARVSYAMARDGLFFSPLARLDPVHRTPVNALIVQALFASLLILLFGQDRAGFDRLFNYAVFGLWAFYGITVLAVIVLRRTSPEVVRPYHVAGYPWVPLIFGAVAGLFCLSMIFQNPSETGIGLVFLLAGIPFYLYWRSNGKAEAYRKWSRKE
ncbi:MULTISPECIES: APC family permease [Methylococcus]|uniref:Amino acid permease n=1 Tax=Methylococcus capsulatus TaxID=414 RepID=A0ABZ2F2B3_METCP|nr:MULTISPECIES: amino acid permease [Methylococcus]MDF9391382.1 amino acid permease [Methylococcus capsulatus]